MGRSVKTPYLREEPRGSRALVYQGKVADSFNFQGFTPGVLEAFQTSERCVAS
jgi:hypothetical protein